MDVSSFFESIDVSKSQSTQRRHQKLFFNKFIDSKIKESPYLQPQFISSLDKELYKAENLNQPLYRESKTTLLDSLFRHFVNFSSNNGMSKKALDMCLRNEKKVLPQPNCLPGSYKDAYKLLKPLLIKTTTYDACINDCQLFRKTNASDYSMDVECGKCGEARYSDHSPSARKTYTYMPLGPRLVRIYGDDNICKLMFSRPDLSNGKLSDIADGNLYKSWFQRGGVFEDTEERCTVPLALFCDGLNPHKSMATQKSMWPLMLTWLNLPIPVRYILGPMMLVGIVPGTKTEEPKNLDPYLDVLVADVIGNVLGMVTGKDDNKKVRNGEEDFNRFKETWIKRDDEDAEPCSEVTRKRKNDNQSNANQKKQKLQTEISEELPKAPWKVDKPGLKVADTRAKNLVYPTGYDYLADNHFSKPWTLRTMHGKHQFVKSGAALWCLQGLLPKRQENTLRKLFSAIDMMTHESYDSDELDDIIQFTSEAMSLLERDFPIALQTITTHLMHHIPEGYADFGPLYGRWLFPFERINGWITRQALNKNKIEATIMETYAIYDWCVFMIMSGKIKQDDINIGKLEKLLLDEGIDEMKTSIGKKFFIPDTVLSHMSEIYDFCLLQRMTNEGKEVSCCTKLYGNTGREMKYSSVTKQRSSDTFVYAVKIGDDFVANQNCVNSLSDILFGNISKIFEHSWHGKSYTWLLVDIYDDVKFENGFWSTSEQFISQRPLLLQDVSAPQVIGKENNRLYFVSASVSLKD